MVVDGDAFHVGMLLSAVVPWLMWGKRKSGLRRLHLVPVLKSSQRSFYNQFDCKVFVCISLFIVSSLRVLRSHFTTKSIVNFSFAASHKNGGQPFVVVPLNNEPLIPMRRSTPRRVRIPL